MDFSKRKLFFSLILILTAYLIDRLNKYFFINEIGIDESSIIEVTSFLDIVLVWNRGISYGLFQQESEIGKIFLTILSCLICIFLVIWIFKEKNFLCYMPLSLIVGGALSNATDRLLFGAVADFYHLHAYGYSWYVFNIADMCIVFGVFLLIIINFYPNIKNKFE
ncbi:MAG: signal peptidase II [Alphaproteobacteria bacterium]|jgi:signal peptidase II|tara:strand:- start:26551 stop:27045 length:495 start_codon:yes stop_codon:yes gene_type:complete